MDATTLTVGALARAAGLTVRALHHYDRIGLLVPSERAANGYRAYTRADVERLYRIVALRGLGLSLADIGAVLDRQGDLRGAVQAHLAALDRQMAEGRRLRARLVHLLDVIDRDGVPSSEHLLTTIEETTMYEQYYTSDQLAELERRRNELGEDGMTRAQRDWEELIAAVEAERAAGTPPSDPRLAPLMARWQALVEAFTGGDPEVRASLERMYAEQGPAKVSRGAMSPELMAYVAAAQRGA